MKNKQTQNTNPASDGTDIPRALFSCSNEYCKEEVSYYADQLYWHAPDRRWVCENCWDNLPPPTDEEGRLTRGVTLAEHIIGGDFKAVTLLQYTMQNLITCFDCGVALNKCNHGNTDHVLDSDEKPRPICDECWRKRWSEFMVSV